MAQKRCSAGTYSAAAYERLSREDGDRLESDSITNQHALIEDYCARYPEFHIAGHYADDGYTGTNFDRPAFQQMLKEIEEGRVNCVIVKDLSRFGRDYIDMGYYLERYFPAHGVRFVAINDHVDSSKGAYDMMLPLKNVFNTQYAKDISEKVRSAFEVKQRRGQFVGAFACYGYLKDPEKRGHLVIDPAAAAVVRRIFEMAARGAGQIRIAQELNKEGVPCPSEYKRLMGEKYRNCNQLNKTKYWTYATIHRLLANEMYMGHMVQRRSERPAMHGRAKALDRARWIVVENTHDPIITRELWDAARAQLSRNARTIDFEHNVGVFAGLLKCGDCGRSMVKTRWDDRIHYSCGSYRRYGAAVCTKHYIPQKDLEEILLQDINQIIAEAGDLEKIAEQARMAPAIKQEGQGERKRLEGALERIRRIKKSAYEDYKDGLLDREEFLQYKADYDKQEKMLLQQMAKAEEAENGAELLEQPWVEQLLRLGRLTSLDRATVTQTVKEIRVFEDQTVEITYLFSDELERLFETPGGPAGKV